MLYKMKLSKNKLRLKMTEWRNTSMFYTERKLEQRIEELKEYRYREVIPFYEFDVKEDMQDTVNPNVPTNFEGWDKMHTGDRWAGRDKFLWLHKKIQIPEHFAGKKVVGIFDYGNTGAGNNSGFESLLYLNEKPYQGVDSNHKEVFLKEQMIGTTIDFTFRLWSGLEGGGIPTDQEHKINRADLAWLDETADDLYYLSNMVVQTIFCLDENSPIKYKLKNCLNEAFLKIDWSYPGNEAFYQSVYEADAYLNEEIDGMEKDSDVIVRCVGHTHIDVAWLWRLKHTREKISRSFSTVLRLMEQYDEYIFLQTQPQLYEYIKEDFPEIYEQIKKRVKEGTWEVDGAMWVEADCNLTSGESLTRQILIGSRFIKEEFDKDIHYLWLPDVFGYSWALPQILKKSGIDMFMTTKISWNQYNRMPHDTFYWKGIDGSEILTHFITTSDIGSEPGSWFYTYNGKIVPETVKSIWENYKDKEINNEMLICYGYGDGGGGVNRDMLEQRRRIDKIPGLPVIKPSTAKDYFDQLKKQVANTSQYVHTWDGELYLEYHRGTYTSHAYNKKMNRKMELLYRKAEIFTVLSAMVQQEIKNAKQETLTKGWKILLTNQFHDIIPGSSIKEVYDDSRIDYEKVKEIATEVIKDAKETLMTKEEKSYTIFNTSAWSRNDLIELPCEKVQGCFKDETGTILPMQQQSEYCLVYIGHVPATGGKTIHFEQQSVSEIENELTVTVDSIETPFYTILLNKAGQITSLYDKQYDRQVLAEGERANVLQMFEDKPLGNDAWDIDIFYQEKMREVTDLVHIEVKETGPLRAVIAMEWKYQSSIIKQDMIVYANNRRIDFKTYVDYHETHQLLKAAFPVDIRSTYATYDVQYGNVKRPNHWNTSWEQARFETVAQKWVDLSEHNYGVSLLNDCKYGHDIKGNIIRITLLKAATHPDYMQDQGEHEFTYSLLPHKGDFVTGETVKEAFFLNEPLDVIKGKSNNLLNTSLFMIDSDYIEIDAIKQSEDKNYLVLRFHEYTGSKRKITITPGFKMNGFVEADLLEHPLEGETFSNQNQICVRVNPYEIKTYLIQIGS